MSDVLRDMRNNIRYARNAGQDALTSMLEWYADHLERVEADLDRLRSAAEFAINRLESGGDWDTMFALQDALSSATDDQKERRPASPKDSA